MDGVEGCWKIGIIPNEGVAYELNEWSLLTFNLRLDSERKIKR